MKKKLPMKGDPVPEWLRKKPLCSCTNPASHNINGEWFCELCFQAGQEFIFAPLKTNAAIYD